MPYFTVQYRKSTGKNRWANICLKRVREALQGRMAKPSWVGPNRDVIRVDCLNDNDAVLGRLAWPNETKSR